MRMAALLARCLRNHGNSTRWTCHQYMELVHAHVDRYHPRQISTSALCRHLDPSYEHEQKKLMVRSGSVFDEAAKKAKDKVTFRKAVGTYLQREGVYRRGHVEFIYSALSRMKDFGVERDLAVYKQLLEILPPGKMIPQSSWQVEMQHFPKQQQCAIDLMDQMEDYGVIPDNDFGRMMLHRFGPEAHASRKYRRIMYWLPKFKNLNAYPIPSPLPQDPIEMAIVALRRMAVDLENKITIHKTTDMEETPSEDTFIAYGQSPKQQELLSAHPLNKPIYVDGGFSVWVKTVLQTYFVLTADPDPNRFKPDEEDKEELFLWKTLFQEEKASGEVIVVPSIHEQEDGTVLSMCITGTASKDSLVTWIRYLQQVNPRLEQIPVIFRLRSPQSGVQLLEESAESKSVKPS